MISLNFLLSCLLLLASQGWADQNYNLQINEMVNNMVSAKMVEVHEQVMGIRMEMEEKDKEIEEIKNELEELNAKMADVGQNSFKDMPHVISCAYRQYWNTPSATVTYDWLTADYANSDQPGGGDGSIDIDTGVFTTLVEGFFTVTYSGHHASMSPGDWVHLLLMHNGQNIGWHGAWVSSSDSNNGGQSEDQGSRTVVSS